ncbi:flavin reductase family protein [Streptomyces sp. DT24]|uniref:flavin reductase family protein n=1 Tax=unclassified Streptomyces TaxID=2593676 RepID=UPI0023B9B270|nr:flavin reductase family protein [Streptomyces sp. AM 4-1-1]WEH33129.1 flavin reductase family protein [Streptomyces sp. AM 4-1-1]
MVSPFIPAEHGSCAVETADKAVPVHEYKQFAGSFLTGVAVVTARDEDGDHGCTVSSVSSISLDPSLMMVCLHRMSRTLRVIERTGRFAVSLLAQGEQATRTALVFARPGRDAFDQVTLERSPAGLAISPVAVAQAELTVQALHDGGDHAIVLGTPVWTSADDGAPLAYWRSRFLS